MPKEAQMEAFSPAPAGLAKAEAKGPLKFTISVSLSYYGFFVSRQCLNGLLFYEVIADLF